jgi:hypothetical protein
MRSAQLCRLLKKELKEMPDILASCGRDVDEMLIMFVHSRLTRLTTWIWRSGASTTSQTLTKYLWATTKLSTLDNNSS